MIFVKYHVNAKFSRGIIANKQCVLWPWTLDLSFWGSARQYYTLRDLASNSDENQSSPLKGFCDTHFHLKQTFYLQSSGPWPRLQLQPHILVVLDIFMISVLLVKFHASVMFPLANTVKNDFYKLWPFNLWSLTFILVGERCPRLLPRVPFYLLLIQSALY